MTKAVAPHASDTPPAVKLLRPASGLRCLAIVAVPAVLLILGKLKLIERGGGLYHPRAAEFSILEQLSFFRADLLAALVVIPLLTLLLARLLGRWRTSVLAVLSIAGIWILAVEFLTHRVIGRFFSPYLIENSIRFASDQIDIAGVYAPLSAFVRPVALSLVVIAAAWWASRTVEAGPASRWRRAAGRTAAILAVGVTALAWGPWDAPPSAQRGVASYLWASLREEDTGEALEGLSAQQLVLRYRDLTRSPEPLAHPAHFGIAAGCDVILVVLETAPASVAGTLSDDDMPNLTQLQRRGWVGRQHHSTYPFTSYAMWSILNSWYPANARCNYPEFAQDRDYPGLMQSLQSAGYETALYVPDAFTAKIDRPMYDLSGVMRHHYVHEAITPEMRNDPLYRTRRGPIRVGDRMALDALLNDITQWTGRNQRYIAHYAPQLGHAPWPNLEGGPLPPVADRGRAVLKAQDAYIGRIIDHLRSIGRLEKTIILVTGDHGIRTWREDRSFKPGVLDAYTYHVPLTLYCPPAVSQRQDVPWLTSHIDIAPSILDLLGISAGRSAEQGSPLWDARLQDRVTYFFARNYHGVDGYHAGGTFYGYKPVEDVVFRSGRMRFRAGDIVSDERERAQIKQQLSSMAAVQKAWLRLAPARRELAATGENAMAD